MGQGSVESGGRRTKQSKCGFISEVCEEIESKDQIDTEFEELVRHIDDDASSADYIDADGNFPFCGESIDLSNEEWRSLLRNEVLSTKTDENAEPVEKIVCVDSGSEEECVDAEPAQPKITSLSDAIEMLDDLQNLLKEDFKMNLWFPHLIKFVPPCKIWEVRISDKNESVTIWEQHLEFIPKLLNLE